MVNDGDILRVLNWLNQIWKLSLIAVLLCLGPTNLFPMVFCSVVHFHSTSFVCVCVCVEKPFVKLKHIHIISSFYWLNSSLKRFFFPFSSRKRGRGKKKKFFLFVVFSLFFALPSTRYEARNSSSRIWQQLIILILVVTCRSFNSLILQSNNAFAILMLLLFTSSIAIFPAI